MCNAWMRPEKWQCIKTLLITIRYQSVNSYIFRHCGHHQTWEFEILLRKNKKGEKIYLYAINHSLICFLILSGSGWRGNLEFLIHPISYEKLLFEKSIWWKVVCPLYYFAFFLSSRWLSGSHLKFPGTTLTPSKARSYYTVNLDRLISNDKS